MTDRITKLTKAQSDRMPEWRDKWIAAGLQTGETNWELFEDAVTRCYQVAGLGAVPPLIRVTSPMAGALAAPLAAHVNAVWSAVRSAVESAVWSDVGSDVESAVRSAVRSSGAVRRVWWHDWYGGQLWCQWPAYLTFLVEVCGWRPKCLPAIECYRDACLAGSYWWPNKDFCMVAARPITLHRNDSGQLHNTAGMSISWPDGWGLWLINGTTVDEQVVMRPETQTIQQIDAEKNEDVRSIRIERFGWPRYLEESASRLLDARHNAIENTREALFVSPKGERRLVCTCPTGRVFALGVPQQVQTCEQAQEWLSPRPVRVLART